MTDRHPIIHEKNFRLCLLGKQNRLCFTFVQAGTGKYGPSTGEYPANGLYSLLRPAKYSCSELR
jgi:hypothetical protein